jgi:V8-like Glu-specific endopeptidase
MGLSRDLVAEIYSPANHAVGSGYFCTSRLILTAKHVVSGALPNVGPVDVSTQGEAGDFDRILSENRTVCRVRSLSAGGGGPFVDAIPVWWSESADVALLALKAQGTHAGAPRTVTWADVREGEPIDVTAVGFPEADTENGVRESRQISGRLNPISGVKANRLIVHVNGSIAELPAGVGSSWAGMSGAALFAGEFLIGVVLGDADVLRSDRLELWALPARSFADNHAFLNWIRWDGGEGAWSFSSDSPTSSMALLTEIAKANRQSVRARAPLERDSVSATSHRQPISHIPYPRNPNFTGRVAQLETMHNALTSRRTAALTQAIAGLGGVGKTQLAMEYSYRYAHEYDVIWWVRSELQETRLNDIVALGKALGETTSSMDASASLKATLDWLDRYSGWLLVFDNAENPNQIRDLLPKARNGSIIITSRFGAWGAVAQILQVDSWSPTEAVAFLCQRTSQSDERSALGIADLLGYLPLALAQVAAYVEESGCSLMHYFALLKGNPSEALKLRPQSSDAEKAIATIWEISLKQLTTKSSDAVAVLSLFSFLAPDRILHETLLAHTDKLPSSLSQIVTNGFRLNAAIAALRSYSLVNTTADGFSVHRLVQAVVRTRLNDDAYRLYSEAAKEIEGTLSSPDFKVTPKPQYRFWPLQKRALVVVSLSFVVLLSGDRRKASVTFNGVDTGAPQSEIEGDNQGLSTDRASVMNHGREVAAKSDFRYQVALVYSTKIPNAREGQFCGGTLIGRHWVVTSAHCVNSVRNTDLYVFEGSHKLSANGRRLAVQSIKLHSGYNPSNFENDIALLRLVEDLPIEESITPLTEALEQTVLKTVTAGVVSGWGSGVQGSQEASDDLTYAFVPLIDRQVCNGQGYYSGRITTGMVCAGGPNADACQGDGGGPLVLKFGTKTYLYGIVSWGEGCGHVNKPGVYTRVPAFIVWLNEAMR